MNKLATRFTSAAASLALFGTLMAPAAFAVIEEVPNGHTPGGVLVIEGNGSDSTNRIKVNNSSDCTVKQKSNTNAVVGISVYSNTGGNVVAGNTGGDTDSTTGDIDNTVDTTILGGSNVAVDPCSCLCEEGDVIAGAIIGNGRGSDNKIKVKNQQSSYLKQKSNTNLVLGVDLTSKTGNNKVKNNTGGSSGLLTGGITNFVSTLVTGGSNATGSLLP